MRMSTPSTSSRFRGDESASCSGGLGGWVQVAGCRWSRGPGAHCGVLEHGIVPPPPQPQHHARKTTTTTAHVQCSAAPAPLPACPSPFRPARPGCRTCLGTMAGRRLAKALRPARIASRPRSGRCALGRLSHLYLHEHVGGRAARRAGGGGRDVCACGAKSVPFLTNHERHYRQRISSPCRGWGPVIGRHVCAHGDRSLSHAYTNTAVAVATVPHTYPHGHVSQYTVERRATTKCLVGT